MTVASTPTEGQGPIAEAARIWVDGGFSIVPIRADGSKRPSVEWKAYQSEIAPPDKISEWWHSDDRGTQIQGIAVVCGKVSGNLELCELEGRATSPGSLSAIDRACLDRGVHSTWLLLTGDDGYSERSPSGGIHLLYRIVDHEVPGNTKIARRPATTEELVAKPDDKIKVLAETRGEGGYVIVAPTPGTVHSSGLGWSVLSGRIGDVPEITWDQRNAIHDAIRSVLDRMPEPVDPPRAAQAAPQRVAGVQVRPGDDFNERAEWADILEPAGWTIHHMAGGTTYWTRPGKSRRDGHSATTGHAGTGSADRLYVMSSATDLPTEEPLSKFWVYAHYNHGGDTEVAIRAAVKDLARQGYGDQIRPSVPAHPRWEDWGAGLPDTPSNVDSPVAKVSAGLPRSPRGRQDYTISGAANRFVAEQGRYFWYVTEEKCWRVWNGVNWERDDIGSKVSLAFEAMTEDMMDEADQMLADAQTDPDKLPMAKAYNRHVNSIRNAVRKNIVNLISQHRSIAASAFDADTRYLNLRNGVYDLTDDVFLDHHPKYMLTKVSGVDYDPDAKAPRTEAFFDELLPSEPMREFVLQGLGYSLTGEADRKAMFILQGQSNSGKTQLTELVQGVFGDYAVSVSPGTFAKRHDSSGPNPELHDIRSARFVYSSETSHDLALDEELVKRVTGKDTMSTRTLYEKSQRWIPQCVVWVATNNLPRFGSDSEAIWRRVKTVRFVNEFTEDGSSGHVAQPNIGRNLAQAEASGVFNLLLEALRRYRAAGRLVEPSELKESVATHRQETDPVAQWVAHVRDKGQLVARPGGRTDQKVLRKAYETWCADEGFRPLAANRFGVALAQNLDYERLRSNGDTWVVGWHWTGSSWAVGQAIFGDWRDRE